MLRYEMYDREHSIKSDRTSIGPVRIAASSGPNVSPNAAEMLRSGVAVHTEVRK